MDDPGGSSSHLWLILILLALSALFSATETALFSLTPLRRRLLSERLGKRAEGVEKLARDGQRLLLSLLVGNTAVNILATGLITTLALNRLGGPNIGVVAALVTVGTTLLLLIFGEVTPKALAALAPESVLLLTARPIALIHAVLTPLSSALDALMGGMRKTQRQTSTSITENTIRTAVSIGEAAGTLDSENREMIFGIFAADDIPVGRVMIGRERIAAVPIDLPLKEVAGIFSERGFSRLPVYRDNIDRIIGLAYAKDVLALLRQQKKTGLADVLRPVIRTVASRPVSSLLQEMRQKHTQMAIVSDAAGKTIGLVTMEDLLEEIVGDIVDEYDLAEGHSLSGEGAASC